MLCKPCDKMLLLMLLLLLLLVVIVVVEATIHDSRYTLPDVTNGPT